MIWLAVAVHGLAVASLSALEHRWLPTRSGNAVSAWWVEHLGLPGARAACVMLFVACAWPSLYGLDDAPGFAALIGRGGRLGDWFNALFLAGLLLPLLPLSHRFAEFVLPLQGALAVAMVFRWAAVDQTGQALPVWPDAATLGFCVTWSVLNRVLATALRLRHRGGRGDWVIESLLLWMQLPMLLVYASQLGEQLR